MVSLLSVSVGCATWKSRPGRNEDHLAGRTPDFLAAAELNAEGVELAEEGKQEEARMCFEAALERDATFGPAQNNLGVLFFKQHNYYEAAWRLNFAMKLMPRSVSVRTNLGLVLEAAGRPDQALEHYEAALSLLPNDPMVTAYLARASIKARRDPKEVTKLLKQVAMNSVDESWNTWARRQLLRLGQQSTE